MPKLRGPPLPALVPPEIVFGVELDDGRAEVVGTDPLTGCLNRRALEMFRDCRESGVWPGYQAPDTYARVSLPRWAWRAARLRSWVTGLMRWHGVSAPRARRTAA